MTELREGGGNMEHIDLFDALFFGYTPREAEIIDPQHRMFLECAWHALEDAGYDPDECGGVNRQSSPAPA